MHLVQGNLFRLFLWFLVLLVPTAANAQIVELQTSVHSTRADSIPLGGSQLFGTQYIFVTEVPGIASVEFYINESALDGTPVQIEGNAPYDLAGTFSNGRARKFNVDSLSLGQHFIEALVWFNDGTAQVVTDTFQVVDPNASGGGSDPDPVTYELLYSAESNRSNELSLNGSSLNGDVYIFLSPEQEVSNVNFYINQLDATPDHTETVAPFDFIGGTVAAALPFDTDSLATGQHTVYAEITTAQGVQTISAVFTVDNDAPALVFAETGINRVIDAGDQAAAVSSIALTTSDDQNLTPTLTVSASWLSASLSNTGETPTALAIQFVNEESLAAGTYTATITAAFAGYTSAVIEVNLTVQALGAGTYSLMVSDQADRSNATLLNNQVLLGDQYIFISPETGVNRVEFYLDDFPGTFRQRESRAPYDFAGTNGNGTGRPWDTAAEVQGSHTVIAEVFTANGSEIIFADIILNQAIIEAAAFTTAPAQLSKTLAIGETGQETVYLGLNAAGDGSAPPFTVGTLPAWLTVTPSQGFGPETLEFDFDASVVTQGTYTATVTVFSTELPSITIPVTFQVNNPNLDDLSASVSSVVLNGEVDATDINATITVSSSTGGGATYQASANASWVLIDNASGSLPSDLTINIDTNGLSEGTHNALVTLTANNHSDLIVPITLTLTSAGSNGDCAPVSCEDIRVDLPYSLTFDSDAGFLMDVNGIGTGFTYFDVPSNGDGYLPALIDIDLAVGQLSLTSTAGIQYRQNNSQDNVLGVGFAGANQVTSISGTLRNPGALDTRGRYEQAGIWFGVDEDNYSKLVFIDDRNILKIQYLVEVDGQEESVIEDVLNQDVSQADIRFEIIADPFRQQVIAQYAIGENPFILLGTVDLPPEFFSFDAAGIDPRIGTRSFAGILSTYRRGPSPITWTFRDFVVQEGDIPIQSSQVAFDRKSHPLSFPTSMAWGPDGRLYVAELFGDLHAITYDDDLNVIDDELITAMTDALGAKLTLGLTVDPDSTAENVILWVSHSSPSVSSGELNSGAVTRLSGSGFSQVDQVITGLPRAIANHAPNSLHFGDDGRLYIAIGGNTGAGSPVSATTEFGDRPEQPLSAAILVADVKAAGFDGACYKPSDGQDPLFGDPLCDVSNYATGLRNSYDFVFHSNGHLYATDNGLGVTGGFPPSPSAPCFGIANENTFTSGGHNPGQQPDLLYRVEEGLYYGHPNPSRDECIFKDGSFQGVAPESNFQQPIANLGLHTSSNGITEYRSTQACGAYDGLLLITNFSAGDNILAVDLSDDGLTAEDQYSFAGGFVDPLTLSVNDAGDIFVGEFGSGQITALRLTDLGCWTTLSNLPLPVLDAASAELNGLLYGATGKTATGYSNDTFAYDPVTDSWVALADKPGVGVENAAGTSHGGYFYVFGGSTAPASGVVSDSYRYDPATDQWQTIAPMPTARGGIRAEVVGDKIYVIGGMDDNGTSLSVVEIYDPATGQWSTTNSMQQVRDNPGSAVHNGQIYVFGGRERIGSTVIEANLSSAEVFDPSTGTWSFIANMPTGRRTMVVGVLDDMILVIGGEKNDAAQDGMHRVSEAYDPSTNSWSQLSAPPNPRHGAIYGVINGALFISGGGLSSGSSFTSLTEVYDTP